MDNKTMQKVINGQEDKINKLFDLFKSVVFDYELQEDLKELNDKIKEDNKCVVEDLEAVINKVEDLDERIIKVNDRTSKLIKQSGDYIIDINDKIKELEQKANRTGQFHLDAINEKLSKLEKNENYKKLWQENTDDYNELARKRLEDYTKGIKNSESIDNLESKYYKLRSELDAVYKVLEMDALDIQDLYNKIDKHPKNKEELNQETLEILIKEQDENAK